MVDDTYSTEYRGTESTHLYTWIASQPVIGAEAATLRNTGSLKNINSCDQGIYFYSYTNRGWLCIEAKEAFAPPEFIFSHLFLSFMVLIIYFRDNVSINVFKFHKNTQPFNDFRILFRRFQARSTTGHEGISKYQQRAFLVYFNNIIIFQI